jgi:hypothetical protein
VFRPDDSVQILEVGASIPWNASALGKAIVAYLDPERRAALLGRHASGPTVLAIAQRKPYLHASAPALCPAQSAAVVQPAVHRAGAWPIAMQ